MVNFYVARIKAGKMIIEDVPPRWRAQVAMAVESEKAKVEI